MIIIINLNNFIILETMNRFVNNILNTLNEDEYKFLQVLVIACRDIKENGSFKYDDSKVLKQYTRHQYAGYCSALSKKQIITMYDGSCYHDGALKRLFNEYFKG